MNELAILLRTKQLLNHNYHNICKGPIFSSDHAMFADLYSKAEDQYDSLIERMIGLGQMVDLNSIQAMAVEGLKAYPSQLKENADGFKATLSINAKLLQAIEPLCKSGKLSQGSLQLVGGLADELEGENYKLTQRVKK